MKKVIEVSENNYLVALGERISQKRKEKRFTQERLAESIGVSLQTVSNIECGRKAARPETIAKICFSLDVTADYILLGQKSENDMKGIIKTISLLPDDEYRVVNDVINLLQSRVI